MEWREQLCGQNKKCFACAAARQRTEGPEQGLASAREGAQGQRQNTPGRTHGLCGRMLAVNDTMCNEAVVRISQHVLSPFLQCVRELRAWSRSWHLHGRVHRRSARGQLR